MLIQDLEGIGHGLIEITFTLSCQPALKDWHSSWLPGSTLTMYCFMKATEHTLIHNYALKHRIPI